MKKKVSGLEATTVAIDDVEEMIKLFTQLPIEERKRIYFMMKGVELISNDHKQLADKKPA